MQPSNAPERPGQVAPTNVLGAYQLSSNIAEQNYAQKVAQMNALYGGLAGLGGNMMLMNMYKNGNPFSFGSGAAGASSAGGGGSILPSALTNNPIADTGVSGFDASGLGAANSLGAAPGVTSDMLAASTPTYAADVAPAVEGTLGGGTGLLASTGADAGIGAASGAAADAVGAGATDAAAGGGADILGWLASLFA
jgi:hypothetical protein